MELRPATSADADAIARVHVMAWRHAYRDILPPPLIDNLSAERRAESWRSMIADDRTPVCVATKDGELAGFACFGASRDDDAEDSLGELHELYVHPARQGNGVGAALEAEARGRLAEQGFDEATLWVLTENDTARRFYEAHGWLTDGGERTEEFGDGEDLTEVAEVRYRTDL